MSTRLLILCPDPVGDRMSGMGIRYTEIARCLATDGTRVTLAGRETQGAPPAGVRWAAWPADRIGPLRALLSQADIVLAPPLAPHVMRVVRSSGVRLAVDLYDPESLEVLERFRTARNAIRTIHLVTATDKVVDALRSGQFFVCASERQRDLWLGAMLALGLLRPSDVDMDPSVRTLLDVVPFGVPDTPPASIAHDPIRARFASIGSDDRVVLWNGGLWRWLDAPGAVQALADVRSRGIPAHLVFMGASGAGGADAAVAEARAMARESGVHDAVHFNDVWVPYDRRGSWLTSADVAISAHRDHLETRFAYRTRLLDCFWAALPPVVSSGDALADEIARHDLGAVAAPGDAAGLARGIETVVTRGRGAFAEGLRAAAERHAWSSVVAPLRAFVRGDVGTSGNRPRGGMLDVSPAQRGRRAAQRLTRLARALRG